MTSAITTSIAVDPALVQNAAYRFNPADRQYIDDQIRGCQKQIVDCVASGVQCTWLDIDAASAAVSVGDLGCSAASATNSRTVKKVSAGTIGAAKSIHCMFLTAGAPGARVLCAVGGRIPRSITGLASIGGVAVANIVTGRADTKASLADDDYPIGSVDSGGNLSLVVGQPQFQVVFNGGGGFSVGIYVDVAGDDGTGTRGNASLPYQTIGAALATMHSGDVIFAGPGSFAGALVGPELAAVSIVGSGENETTITSADAAATIVFSPLVTKLQSLTIARCTVTNTGAGQAIFVGGDRLAALGVCVTGALVLDHVRTVGAVEVRCAGNVRGSDNQIIGEIILNEVDNADFFATTNNGDVHCRWQLAAVLPAGVGGAHRQRFIGCALGDLKPSDVTHVECWGGKCASVTATLTDDGAIEGTFKGDGELGAVSISSTSVAAVSSAVLDGAHMSSLTTASAVERSV